MMENLSRIPERHVLPSPCPTPLRWFRRKRGICLPFSTLAEICNLSTNVTKGPAQLIHLFSCSVRFKGLCNSAPGKKFPVCTTLLLLSNLKLCSCMICNWKNKTHLANISKKSWCFPLCWFPVSF